MASNKEFKTRVQHKIDTPENWELAKNFKPLKGELIIYADENTKELRIGDGETLVNDLPLINTMVQIITWGVDD